MEYNKIINLLIELKSLLKDEKKSNWLDIKAVSEYTSLSIATLRRRISQGSLKVSKTTGKNLFRREWADKLLGD